VDLSPKALGEQIVAILGPGGSRELLDILTRPEADRALIGRLSQCADGERLAEVLMDVESDPDGITRLRQIAALERAFKHDPL
jgi:hypothetical protein